MVYKELVFLINSKDSPWSNQPTWRRTWWLVHDPVCSWQGLSWNTWAEWHVECQVHPVLKQLLLRPCGVPIIWLRGTTWLPHQHQSINGFGKDLATNMWGKWAHHICSSHWLIRSPQSTIVQCPCKKHCTCNFPRCRHGCRFAWKDGNTAETRISVP